MNKNIHYLF